MPVFKLCLKIIKKNLPVVSIYFFVFIGVSILFTIMAGTSGVSGFANAKSKVVIRDMDKTPLTQGLREALKPYADYVDISTEEGALKDAMFFRQVTYVLTLEEGFTDDFLKKDSIQVQALTIPNDTNGIYMDLKVNQYLKTLKVHTDFYEDVPLEDSVNKTLAVLSKEVGVEMVDDGNPSFYDGFNRFYFNYMAYALMFIVIMGISSTMIAISESHVKMRNMSAPIKAGRMSLEIFLANGFFAVITWLVLVLICFIFGYKTIFQVNTLYYLLNAFVFALVVASISYLIGSWVRNREALAAIANVLTLGSSFLSGIFMPQFLLGESVLRFARFLPAYWYVKANDRISEIAVFTQKNSREILSYIFVEVIFLLVFITVALVGVRRKYKHV